MSSTNSFVVKTLRCPLGQLSNAQIDEGRSKLEHAKKIIAQNKLGKSEKDRLEQLTNDFYGLIPHNLGSGARGQMTHLLLDTQAKILQKEYDLDTLLDAKAIGTMLTSDSTYDQYLSLETSFNFIDHDDSLFAWLNDMVQQTRASNHNHLGKIVLLNAWDIQRKGELEAFLKSSKSISVQCGKQVIPDQMGELVRRRKDVDNLELYKRANIIPLFHGTRTQNISGILKQGMLIRPSGVIITGAMYGNAIYWGKSTKSINYTNIKSSYWAGGTDDRAFLFIGDCALGSQLIARGPSRYTARSIAPKHSVWARGGSSGVINDEFMLYRTDQHNLRYLLEFTCKK
jgi:poly [ADP-ribose] polymerase